MFEGVKGQGLPHPRPCAGCVSSAICRGFQGRDPNPPSDKDDRTEQSESEDSVALGRGLIGGLGSSAEHSQAQALRPALGGHNASNRSMKLMLRRTSPIRPSRGKRE